MIRLDLECRIAEEVIKFLDAINDCVCLFRERTPCQLRTGECFADEPDRLLFVVVAGPSPSPIGLVSRGTEGSGPHLPGRPFPEELLVSSSS